MLNIRNYYEKEQINTFLAILESITRGRNNGKCLLNDHVLEISFTVTPKDVYENLEKYFKEKGFIE